MGYGRAEKPQVQAMMKLLLGLDVAPSPHDVADALAVAICHVHASSSTVGRWKVRHVSHIATRILAIFAILAILASG